MTHPRTPPASHWLHPMSQVGAWLWQWQRFWSVAAFWAAATASLAFLLLAPVFGPPAQFSWAFSPNPAGLGAQTQSTLSDDAALGVILLVGGLMLLLSIYLAARVPSVATRPRYLLLMLAIILLTVLAARITLRDDTSAWVYAFPLAAASMTIAALLDAQLGLVTGVVLAFLVGSVVGQSFMLSLLYAVGASVGALSLGRVDRLRRFGIAGLLVGLTAVPLAGAFTFIEYPEGRDLTHSLIACLAALAGGELSGVMALSLYSFFGSLFGITTMLQLFDASRPNHPLLQRLLLEAPGTYHHSIVVSAMAERAAQNIGADSLLARVGAFYHDIGKVERPQSFIENQFQGRNVHDSLSPVSSAKMLRYHISDGLRLASKHHLPARVRDCIAEHHGTLRMEYFYAKAARLAAEHGQDPPNESRFRYAGPKPRSKETAILMLADGVEPMVRAGQAGTSLEEMEQAIRLMFQDRLADGQFTECGLTTQEFELICQAFVSTLRGMFHQRIPYPETLVEEEPESETEEIVPPADFSLRRPPVGQVS
jgi:putative nucleotidyltransferase with HDIG domain